MALPSPTAGSTADTSLPKNPSLPPALSKWVIPAAPSTTATPAIASSKDLLEELARFVGLPDAKGKQSIDEILDRLAGHVGLDKSGRAAPKAAGKGPQQGGGGPGGILGYAESVPGAVEQLGKDLGGGGKGPGLIQKASDVVGGAESALGNYAERIPGAAAAVVRGANRGVQEAAGRVAGVPEGGAPSDQTQPETKKAAEAKAAKAVTEELTPEQQAQLARIAAHIGAEPTLAGVADKLGVTPNATAVGGVAQPGQTAGEAYTNFVKKLSSTAVQEWFPGQGKQTFKAASAMFLERGNFISATANGGTPDDATIAGGFSRLLAGAQSSNTNLTDAYNQGIAGANTAGGGPPISSTSEATAYVQNTAEKLGVYLTPDQINHITNLYSGDITNAGGPTTIEDELKNTIVQYYDPNNPNNPPGAANDMFLQIQSAASDYGIPVSSADITKWVVSGIQNAGADSYSIAAAATNVTAQATQAFQQQAAGLYPSLAPQILAGQKVSTLVAPYNNITADVTGVSAASLADPGSAPGGPTGKYYSFLQGAKDPKTGAPVQQTMDEWRKTLMQNPSYGFQNTQGGKDLASQFSAALLNFFGRTNTMGGTSQPFNNYGGTQFLSSSANPNAGQ